MSPEHEEFLESYHAYLDKKTKCVKRMKKFLESQPSKNSITVFSEALNREKDAEEETRLKKRHKIGCTLCIFDRKEKCTRGEEVFSKVRERCLNRVEKRHH